MHKDIRTIGFKDIADKLPECELLVDEIIEKMQLTNAEVCCVSVRSPNVYDEGKFFWRHRFCGEYTSFIHISLGSFIFVFEVKHSMMEPTPEETYEAT